MTRRNLGIHWDLVKKIRIDHPAYVRALDEVAKALKGVGNSVSPTCRLIIGESGTGKSSVIEDICDQFTRQRTAEGLQAKLVWARAPSDGTCKGMAEKLLFALGDEHWHRGTLANMTARLLVLLRATNCRCIVVDEFQHLSDKGQDKRLNNVSDWLKLLVEDQSWGLIGVGLPRSQRVINQNEQLARRFDAPLIMPAFDWNSESSRDTWIGIVERFQDDLSPFELPNLALQDNAYRVFLATAGRVGLLAKLLERAVREAIEDNRTRIGFNHLEEAFELALWHAPQFPVPKGPFGATIDALYGGVMGAVENLVGSEPVAPDVGDAQVYSQGAARVTQRRGRGRPRASAKAELARAFRC